MAVTTILSICRLGAHWARNLCFLFENNLKGADRSRHTFVHSAIDMVLDKNPAVPPSSSIYYGQYDTTHATIGGILQKAFFYDTILGDEREPPRM